MIVKPQIRCHPDQKKEARFNRLMFCGLPIDRAGISQDSGLFRPAWSTILSERQAIRHDHPLSH